MRHIFVDGLRSNQGLPQLSEKGAAMAMGNSTRTWDACYDTRFHGRLAQSAVDGFGAWHAALTVQRVPTAEAVPPSQPVASSAVPDVACTMRVAMQHASSWPEEADDDELVIDLTFEE